MKNKLGLTLVELLAVIVVLAILSLITIPVISNVIDNVRIKSLQNSAYGLIEASNLYYISKGNNTTVRFDKNDTKDTLKELSYKGVVKIGTVIIDKKGKVTVCITDGKNSAYKNYNETKVTTSKGKICHIKENSSIVYLDDKATINEYDGVKLTEIVTDLQTRMTNVEEENATLKSENETLKSQVNASATKSELNALDTRLSSSISSLSNDISTVDSKIYTPVIVDVSNYQARTTTFEYTGVSVTIPANSYYVLKGLIGFRYSQTKAVALTRTNGLTYPQCSNMDAISNNGEKACTISGTTGNSSQTFYLFGQWDGATNNEASITGFYLQKQS